MTVDPDLGSGASGAARLTIIAGNNQSGTIDTDLAVPFTVLLKDADNNPMSDAAIDWSVQSGGGTLEESTMRTGSSGAASVRFRLPNFASQQVIMATVRGSKPTLSVTFSSSATPEPSNMVLTVSNASPTAGTPITAMVRITDQYNNVRTDYLGTVQLSTTDPQATLASSYTFTSGATGSYDNGLHAFNIVFRTAGSHPLTIEDPASGLSQTVVITVAPAAANRLEWITNIAPGSSPSAGTSLPTIAARVVDNFSNTVVTHAANLVVTARNQAGANVPIFGTATFAPSSGTYSVSGLSIQLAGSQNTLRLTSGTLPVLSSTAFDVVPGSPTYLTIESGNAQSGYAGAGLANPIVARLTDFYLNNISNAAVAWSVSSGTLSTLSGVTNSNGRASTSLNLPTTAAAITGQVAHAGLQANFTATANPGIATSLVVVSGNNQSNVVANVLASPFVIEARDQHSNPVPNVPITWTVTSGTGTLSSTSSTTSSTVGPNLGRASTGFTLPTVAGAIAVQARITGSSPTIATSFAVTASPDVAATFEIFGGNNQSGPVGTALASLLEVRARDVHGNPLSGQTVDWLVTSGTATLTLNQSTTGGTGRATTGVQLPTVTGLQAVRATLAGSTLPAVIFAATADPTNAIGSIYVNLASTTIAGAPNVARVEIRDQLGNVKNNFSGSIALTSSDPRFRVTGGNPYVYTTGAGADNGSHDFEVFFESAGLQSFVVDGPSGSTQSANVTVSAAPATTLVWTTNVSTGYNVAAGQPLPSTTVRAVDPYGNTDKNYTAAISLVLNPNPGAASIVAGSASIAAVEGSVSFTGLAFDKATTGYRLLASGGNASNGLSPSSASSNLFNVVAGAPSQMIVLDGAGQSGAAGSALANALKIGLQDAYNNPVSSATIVWSAPSGSFAPSSTVATNSSGESQVTYTLPQVAGAVNVKAAYYGASTLEQDFALQADPAAPTKLTIVSGNGQSGASGSNLTLPFVVLVTDTYNNPVPGASIGWSSDLGFSFGAGVPSASTVADANGEASVTGTLPLTTGSGNVVATITGSNPLVTKSFSVTAYAGVPNEIEIVSGNNQSGYVSGQLTNPLTVVVRDVNSNPVPNVQVNWSPSAGTSIGSSSMTNALGQAFSYLLLPTSTGAITLEATVDGTALSTQFDATANPSAVLGSINASAAATVVAGQPLNVTLTARDSLGNVKTDFAGTVDLDSSDAQVDFNLGGDTDYTYTTGTTGGGFDNGAHVFSIILKTKGSQTLTFDAGGGINRTITVNVTPAPATKLVLAADLPSGSYTAAASISSLTVRALDAYNNIDTNYTRAIAVALNPNPASATLAGSTSQTAVAGEAVFSGLSIAKAGTGNRLLFTSTNALAVPLTSVSTSLFNVVAGPAATLVTVAGYTSQATVNTSVGTLSVQAFDAQSNPVPNLTIAWTSNAGGTFTLSSSNTNASGVASTDFTLPTGAGGVTVTGTYFGSSTLAANLPLTALGGAATNFTVAGHLSPSTAGVQRSVTVTARDTYGNVATNYTGAVDVFSSDPLATAPSNGLPANVSFTASVGTFNATLKTAGTQSITVTDEVTSSITGSQTGISVTPATASVLVVSGFPATPTAGVAGNVSVTAKDPYGNTVTGYPGTVHFTSTDGLADLPVDSTLTNGTASFLATLKTVGSLSITATDTVSGITGVQTGITVSHAAAASFVLSGFPSTVSAGSAQNLTVTAKDAFGNTATGYAGTVQFTSNDGQAVLPANTTLTSGAITRAVTLRTAGSANRSLTATDTVSATITGSQTGITVNSGSATSFTVSGFSATPNAGTAGSVTVTAKDVYGNTDTVFAGTVVITSSDLQAVLPSSSGLGSGVGSFNVTLKTAGSRSITATSGGVTGAQTGINVQALAATHMTVAGFPTPIVSYSGGNVTVTARDTYENVATAYAGTVTFTSSDGAAQLPANSTLSSGTGSFAVTFQTPGTHSITATDTVTGSIAGSQTSIVVTAGPAVSFVVSLPSVAGIPTSTPTAGDAGTVTVTAKDLYGETSTGYTGTVQITSSDGQAVRGANATLSSGVGTFSVTLKTAGAQSITATDTLNGSITGSRTGITVAPAALNKAVYTTAPRASLQTSMPFNPVIQARDVYNNNVSGPLSASLAVYTNSGCTTPSGAGTLTNSSGSTDANGTWAPGGVKWSAAGSFYLGATISGAGTVACSAFTTTAAVPSASLSNATASPNSVVTGSASAILVVAKDSESNPIQGVTVSIASSRGATDTISANQVTDATGQANFSVSSTTVGRAIITATVGSTSVSQKPIVYFLKASPLAEYIAPHAQSALIPGSNSPATSSWYNRAGSSTYEGYLNGFAYTTSSGWAGNGGTAAVGDPYQLVFDGSTASSVDFGQSANDGGFIEAFVRMPATLGASMRRRVIYTNGDASGNGFILRYSGLGATQIAASQALPLQLTSGPGGYEDAVTSDTAPIAYWPSPSTHFKDEVGSYNLSTSGSFGYIPAPDNLSSSYELIEAKYPVNLRGTTRRFLSGGYSYSSSNVPSGEFTVEAWTRLADTTPTWSGRACAPGDPNYTNFWAACATRGKVGDAAPSPIVAKRHATNGLQWALYWSGGKITWKIGANVVQSSTSPTVNAWHHVVVTQANSGAFKMYIDGVLRADGSFTMTNDAAPVYIGYDSGVGGGLNGTSTTYAMGNITDVALYSSVLDEAKILANYAARTRESCEIGLLPLANAWNFVTTWAKGTSQVSSMIQSASGGSGASQMCTVNVTSAGGAANAFDGSSGNLIFGANRTQNGNFFQGSLGELRVFPYTAAMANPVVDVCYYGWNNPATQYGWTNGTTPYASQVACQVANPGVIYNHYSGEKVTYP